MKLAKRMHPPPPRRLLTPCAKEARGPSAPLGGMGIGLRGLASASNAQEVKFAVLGAELRRRLKKSQKDRSVSPESKIQFAHSQSSVPAP